MAYSAPSIDAAGLHVPPYADILAYLIGQYQAIYGAAAYLGPDSADYQDISIRALQANDISQLGQLIIMAFNPQTATGASLDLVGRLIGTSRRSASYSTALLTLTGTPGAVILNGIVKDVNGRYWYLPAAVTIGSAGTATAIATARTLGALTANPGDISVIANPTSGWTGAINVAAATPGTAIEPDSTYRARLLISQAKPSLTMVAGTAAVVAAVAGVTRSTVYENPTNDEDSNGTPPHSITCVAEGGAAADIAQAIYDNKGIGCYTNGTTTVTVEDPLNPAITMPIRFYVLGYVPVYVALSVHALTGFTSATQAAIAAAVVAYLNSLGIGQSVVISELWGAALSARPDPDHPLFSIRAVTAGAAVAVTAGTTVSGSSSVTVTSGTGIANGQVVVGAGIPVGTTVSGISGTTVTLSVNATASASGVALSFFAPGTPDIAVPFTSAARGVAANVAVSLV